MISLYVGVVSYPTHGEFVMHTKKYIVRLTGRKDENICRSCKPCASKIPCYQVVKNTNSPNKLRWSYALVLMGEHRLCTSGAGQCHGA
jgi:hypothetical protein